MEYSVKQTPNQKMGRIIVMNENERLVTENVAENAEQTAEETPKTYTEAEFNAKLDEVIGKKLARKEAKIRKEYEGKYGDLMGVLEAGTGEKDVTKVTDTFKKFYESKGIKMPNKADYSAKDIEVLARAEADDIIRSGFDEVVEETDRMAERGDRMTAREQAVFKILAEHRHNAEVGNKLAEIGVTEEEYNSPEFKEFHKMFNGDVPLEKVYETYRKTQPKKEFKTAGSMKNTTSAESGVKEYYSPEEARRFTAKDFRDHPEIEAAVLNSMQKWK
jgi:hypothetical protein